MVCTASCILMGTAHLMPQHRLLDDLNSGFVASMHHLGEEFLPLTEVRVLYPGGEQDIALSTHVRKSNILFVAERAAGQGERVGTRDTRGPTYRVKRPLCVRIFVPPYTVEGKMHAAVWQELAQTLDGASRFVPMTDVTVSPTLPTGDAAWPFAAVNKDQIVHIGELSEAMQRLRQDIQKALGGEPAGGGAVLPAA